MNYIEFRITKDDKLVSMYNYNNKVTYFSLKDTKSIYKLLKNSGIPPRVYNDKGDKILRYYSINRYIKAFYKSKNKRKKQFYLPIAASALSLITVLYLNSVKTSSYNEEESQSLAVSDFTKEAEEPIYDYEDNTVYIPEDLEPIIEKTYELDFGSNKESERVINVKENYYDLIEKYSNMYGLPVELMLALTANESSGHYDAISNAGAYGLFQVKAEGSWNWLNKELTVYNFDLGDYETVIICKKDDGSIDSSMLFNPEYNIKIGCMIFSYNLKLCNYDLICALQMYNYGTKPLYLKNEYGDDWIYFRDEYLNSSPYIEDVFSFAEIEDNILSFTDEENNIHNIKINNSNNKTLILAKND